MDPPTSSRRMRLTPVVYEQERPVGWKSDDADPPWEMASTRLQNTMLHEKARPHPTSHITTLSEPTNTSNPASESVDKASSDEYQQKLSRGSVDNAVHAQSHKSAAETYASSSNQQGESVNVTSASYNTMQLHGDEESDSDASIDDELQQRLLSYYRTRADTAFQTGQWKEAEVNTLAILKLRDSDPNTINGRLSDVTLLARIQCIQNRWADGLATLVAIDTSQISPENTAQLYLSFAYTYLGNHSLGKASSYCKKALKAFRKLEATKEVNDVIYIMQLILQRRDKSVEAQAYASLLPPDYSMSWAFEAVMTAASSTSNGSTFSPSKPEPTMNDSIPDISTLVLPWPIPPLSEPAIVHFRALFQDCRPTGGRLTVKAIRTNLELSAQNPQLAWTLYCKQLRGAEYLPPSDSELTIEEKLSVIFALVESEGTTTLGLEGFLALLQVLSCFVDGSLESFVEELPDGFFKTISTIRKVDEARLKSSCTYEMGRQSDVLPKLVMSPGKEAAVKRLATFGLHLHPDDGTIEGLFENKRRAIWNVIFRDRINQDRELAQLLFADSSLRNMKLGSSPLLPFGSSKPMHLAAAVGNIYVVTLLKEYGVRLDDRDEGMTALDLFKMMSEHVAGECALHDGGLNKYLKAPIFVIDDYFKQEEKDFSDFCALLSI